MTIRLIAIACFVMIVVGGCHKWVPYTPEECAERELAYINTLRDGCRIALRDAKELDVTPEAVNECIDLAMSRNEDDQIVGRKSAKYFCGAYKASRWE